MKNLFNFLLIIFYLIIFNSCEKEIKFIEPEEIIPKYGTIIIDSNPKGAKVYIDNKVSGFFTPCTLRNPIGKFKLTLKLDLFTDYETYGYLNENLLYKIFFDFKSDSRNLAKLSCSTYPSGANIYLNDSLTNKLTNYVFTDLIPGVYKVKFTLKDHRSDSTIVTLRSKETSFINKNLTDTSKFVIYNIGNSKLVSDYINCITVDDNNHLWIGTTLGLQEIYGSQWKIYNKKNTSLNSENITAIHFDKNRKLWVGTSNGLFLFDGLNWISFQDRIGNISITSINSDINNNIYVGTYSGLYKINEQNQNVNFISTNGNPIKAIAIDKNQNLWLATIYNGILFYDGYNFKVYNNKVYGLNISNQIFSLVFDKNNKLWAITDFYLLIYDGKNWTNKNGGGVSLYVNDDYVIVGDKVGCYLYNLQGSQLKYFHPSQFNFNSLWVSGSVIDHEKNLFLTTIVSGLIKIKKGNY